MDFTTTDMELTNENLIEIVKCGKEVFCNGIFISCNYHPCGWDFLSFENIEEYIEVLDYKFDDEDISDGVYDYHPLNGKTLKEILIKTELKFEFEI